MEKDYYRLGIECYEDDDIDGALDMFHKGASEGDANCLYELGCHYQFGYHYDLKKAIKYYQEAASLGHGFSRLALIEQYHHGVQLPFVKENIKQWLLEAKEADDFASLQLKAFCYINGYGTSKNPKKAIGVYEEMALGGSEDAAWQLYLMYKQGLFVEEDFEKALKWCDVAAYLGHCEAQYEMGKIHEDAKDYETAVLYYQKAVEQDHPEAMYRLGLCYGKGRGVKQDKEKGISLLQRSGKYPMIYAPGFDIDFGEEE